MTLPSLSLYNPQRNTVWKSTYPSHIVTDNRVWRLAYSGTSVSLVGDRVIPDEGASHSAIISVLLFYMLFSLVYQNEHVILTGIITNNLNIQLPLCPNNMILPYAYCSTSALSREVEFL